MKRAASKPGRILDSLPSHDRAHHFWSGLGLDDWMIYREQRQTFLEINTQPTSPSVISEEATEFGSSDADDIDEGLASKGIDFLGRYRVESNEITVTLCVCRIMKFCAGHGFSRET